MLKWCINRYIPTPKIISIWHFFLAKLTFLLLLFKNASICKLFNVTKFNSFYSFSELGNKQCNFRGRLAEFVGGLQEIFDIDHDEITKTISNQSWIL